MLTLESYRAEFPVTERLIYFNHAAVSPISNRVREAMAHLLDDVSKHGALNWKAWQEVVNRARSKAAELIGAAPSEIAFVKNTSEGIACCASGLELQAGDKVVSVQGEFPANIYPWMALAEQGVELDLVEQRDGRIDVRELAARLDHRTKVLTISFVQFLSGFRSDLKLLGRVCRDRGVLFIVDAIQGLGAFPLNVRECCIDALAADSHKWLLGPEGIGMFYCSERLLPRLKPRIVGWTSVKDWANYLDYRLDYREDAGRFECGTLNTASIYGFDAALSLILEVGVERIQKKVLDLTDHLRQGLVGKGFQLYGSREPGESSGIVSFSCKPLDAREVSQALRREGIEVSPRCGKVRVSPHFYNLRSEVDRLLDLLPGL